MISKPDLRIERRLWTAYEQIAGMDEAGRGALAGPVCVGVVVLPQDRPGLGRDLAGVRDSKQLTARKREELAPRIQRLARAWGIGFASATEIDALGIVPATRLAACRALEGLSRPPDYLLTDFRLELPELDIPQTALVRGDRRSLSIAAASILAKTARDRWMVELDSRYPDYGFSRHKGYGTAVHRRMVRTTGSTGEHRKSFRVKN